MHYRLLGRTGLYVSEMCLGTMTFGVIDGYWKVLSGLSQEASTALVKQAFDAGVNFIDTANVYSLGQSETFTGNAIRTLGLPRDELVIATKATAIMDEKAANGRGQSRYHLMNEVDASLKRLQVDHIDIYQVHGFDPLTPLDEMLSTLNDLVRSGKVRYIGLCNMAAWQIMKALAISERNRWSRFESVQAYYTLAGRDLEREVFPLLDDQQLGLMVWSPLAGGLLSGKFAPDGQGPAGARRATFDFPIVDKPRAFACIDVMRPIAERHQVSVARVALAWLLARPQVSTVIVGAKTAAQLADNLAATDFEFAAEELAALDAVSALPPEFPGWMLARQGQLRAKAPVKP
jgi:aryl-alcohol dehydrogenase-like predicted oxidoreductase